MQHPGPRDRVRREAAAITLQEASFRARIEITKLSRYERGLCNLTPEQAKRFEAVLDAAVRARAAAVKAVMVDRAEALPA